MFGAYLPQGNKWTSQTKIMAKERNFENPEEFLAFQWS